MNKVLDYVKEDIIQRVICHNREFLYKNEDYIIKNIDKYVDKYNNIFIYAKLYGKKANECIKKNVEKYNSVIWLGYNKGEILIEVFMKVSKGIILSYRASLNERYNNFYKYNNSNEYLYKDREIMNSTMNHSIIRKFYLIENQKGKNKEEIKDIIENIIIKMIKKES